MKQVKIKTAQKQKIIKVNDISVARNFTEYVQILYKVPPSVVWKRMKWKPAKYLMHLANGSLLKRTEYENFAQAIGITMDQLLTLERVYYQEYHGRKPKV